MLYQSHSVRQADSVYGDNPVERTERPYVVMVQGVASGELSF